jgi:hypothetical protein
LLEACTFFHLTLYKFLISINPLKSQSQKSTNNAQASKKSTKTLKKNQGSSPLSLQFAPTINNQRECLIAPTIPKVTTNCQDDLDFVEGEQRMSMSKKFIGREIFGEKKCIVKALPWKQERSWK